MANAVQKGVPMPKVSKLREILASRGKTLEDFVAELRLQREGREVLEKDGLPSTKTQTKVAKALGLRPRHIWVAAPPREIGPVEISDQPPADSLFWHTMLFNLAAIKQTLDPTSAEDSRETDSREATAVQSVESTQRKVSLEEETLISDIHERIKAGLRSRGTSL